MLAQLMKLIAVGYSFEAGYLPQDISLYYDGTKGYECHVSGGYTKLEMRAYLWRFSAGGSVETVVRDQWWPIVPFRATYLFSTEYRTRHLAVGYEHTCTHSINVVSELGVSSDPFCAAADRVFVRIGSTTEPFGR